MRYFLVAERLLRKLSREFKVPIPELIVESLPKLAGCYYCGEIHIDPNVLRSLSETVKTVKHEFAHYLQDYFNLTKKPEVHARRFETNRLALGVLPKNQTRLVET